MRSGFCPVFLSFFIFLLCAGAGCTQDVTAEPAPPEASEDLARDEIVVNLGGDGHVVFADRDTLPNTSYDIGGVVELIVRDGNYHVRDVLGHHYVIPERRVVYAGKRMR